MFFFPCCARAERETKHQLMHWELVFLEKLIDDKMDKESFGGARAYLRGWSGLKDGNGMRSTRRQPGSPQMIRTFRKKEDHLAVLRWSPTFDGLSWTGISDAWNTKPLPSHVHLEMTELNCYG